MTTADHLLLEDGGSGLLLADGLSELLLTTFSAESGLSFAIEFGFGSTWQTEPDDIVWYDETAYVLQAPRISTNRGASSARGQVDPGSFALTLLNGKQAAGTLRRFDPLYEDGPYFGLLIPGVPVRVTVTPSGQTGAQIITATVSTWPQRWDVSGRLAVVPTQGYDGFDKLSRAKIPRSVLEAAIQTDSPVAYWKLDETSGTQMVDSSGHGYHGVYTVGATALHGEAESDDGGSSPGLNLNGEHSGQVRDVSSVVSVRPCVLTALIAPTRDLNDGEVVYYGGTGNPAEQAALVSAVITESTWAVAGALYDDTANNYASSGARLLRTDAFHHTAFRAPATGATKIYADGVDVTTSNATVTSDVVLAKGSFVGGGKIASGQPEAAQQGFEAHVAVFDTDIGSARIAAHADAALAPLHGQTTDERISWILDELNWPTTARDLETGQTSLGPATFKPGDGALEYLRLVNASEDGSLFVTARGSLRFLDRYWRFTATEATSSQFTFTDTDPDDAGYAEFQLDVDDELLVNTARYTRRGGTEQVATDAASVAAYGEAEKQQSDLLLQTDNEVLSLAEWAVATGSSPQPRCPSIRVPLHRYPAVNQQAVLDLDLGYRVTVVRTPKVGDPITLDMVVDGIAHDIGQGEWWATFFVSPNPEATFTPFRWDVSEWDGTDAWAY